MALKNRLSAEPASWGKKPAKLSIPNEDEVLNMLSHSQQVSAKKSQQIPGKTSLTKQLITGV